MRQVVAFLGDAKDLNGLRSLFDGLQPSFIPCPRNLNNLARVARRTEGVMYIHSDDTKFFALKERVKLDCAVKYFGKAYYIVNLDSIAEMMNNPTNVYKIKSFSCPFGDNVFLYYKGEFIKCETKVNYAFLLKLISPMLKQMQGFEQDNKHHTMNLLDHTGATYTRVVEMDSENSALCLAAMLHDYGKLFTKSAPDPEGCCHFYGHSGYSSAYALLTLIGKVSNDFATYVAALCAHHDRPYQWTMPKTHEKYKKLFGEKFYNDLMKLHRADDSAH